MQRTGLPGILGILLFGSGVLLAALPTGFNYNGAVLKGKKGSCDEYIKNDRTHILKCPDHERALLPDGTVIEVFPDGKKKIRAVNGTLLLIECDGTRTYRSPDGKETVVSMDGKTPYGIPIDQKEETISRKAAVLVIRFNNMKSDDIIDGNSRKFWDDLVMKCRRKIGTVSSDMSFKRKVEFSQCRFSRTGYCRRVNREGVMLELYRGDTLYKKINVPMSELRRQENRDRLVNTVIDIVFSK